MVSFRSSIPFLCLFLAGSAIASEVVKSANTTSHLDLTIAEIDQKLQVPSSVLHTCSQLTIAGLSLRARTQP